MYDLQLKSNSEGISMNLVRFIHHHPTFEIKLIIFKATGRGKILPGRSMVPAVPQCRSCPMLWRSVQMMELRKGCPWMPLVFCGHVVRPVGRFSSWDGCRPIAGHAKICQRPGQEIFLHPPWSISAWWRHLVPAAWDVDFRPERTSLGIMFSHVQPGRVHQGCSFNAWLSPCCFCGLALPGWEPRGWRCHCHDGDAISENGGFTGQKWQVW